MKLFKQEVNSQSLSRFQYFYILNVFLKTSLKYYTKHWFLENLLLKKKEPFQQRPKIQKMALQPFLNKREDV